MSYDRWLDSHPDAPWNQEDEAECPECGAALNVIHSDKYSYEIECTECDYCDSYEDF